MTPVVPWYRRPLPWIGIAIGVLVLCCGGVFANVLTKVDTPAISQPESQITINESPSESPSAEPAPPAPPQPVTAQGSGNSIGQLNATLNGSFRVDYSFASWCGIAKFLKADGSSGAGFLEDINGCSGDTSTPLTGSTIVNLTDVTMVQVDNARGDWSLQLTPLG